MNPDKVNKFFAKMTNIWLKFNRPYRNNEAEEASYNFFQFASKKFQWHCLLLSIMIITTFNIDKQLFTILPSISS